MRDRSLLRKITTTRTARGTKRCPAYPPTQDDGASMNSWSARIEGVLSARWASGSIAWPRRPLGPSHASPRTHGAEPRLD